MKHEARKRVWIDPFQTRLVLRITAYLFMFLVVLINFLFAWRVLAEGFHDPIDQFRGMLGDYLPVALCLLVLVPVMAWDAIRFTHRLLGPLVRFRQTMKSIAEGQPVRPIKLRDGDYLLDLRDHFNEMLESLQRRGVPVLKPDIPVEDENKKKLA